MRRLLWQTLSIVGGSLRKWRETCSDFVTKAHSKSILIIGFVKKKERDSDMIPGNFLEAGRCSQQEKAFARCAKNSG